MGLEFLRSANWLNTRARGYLLLLAAANVLVLAYLVVGSRNGIDRNGFLLGTDFLSFWTAGRMLLAQGDVYDAAAHIVAQRAYFAQSGAYTAFFYPPPFLLACWPLGWLGYFPALALWLAGSGAAFWCAASAWHRQATRPGLAPGSPASSSEPASQPPAVAAATTRIPLPIAFVAFPPVLITITHGQSSFLVAALLGLGALLVGPRPMAAGILLGLAVIKPQFGLFVPLVLLLARQWRTIAAAAATVAVLALGATLAFGPQVWGGWLGASSAAQATLAEGIVPFAKMQSPFAAARLLGVPVWSAYALQGVVTLAVAGMLGLAAWRRGYSPALASAMLVGALLATPFVLDYDMVLLAFPLIYLAGSGFRPWEKFACAAAFVAPAFARPLAMEAGIPIMPLVLAALFVALWKRAAA